MKIIIQFQDQHNYWVRYTEVNHEPTAIKIAKNRAKILKRRHRLVDANGNLIDIINP